MDSSTREVKVETEAILTCNIRGLTDAQDPKVHWKKGEILKPRGKKFVVCVKIV